MNRLEKAYGAYIVFMFVSVYFSYFTYLLILPVCRTEVQLQLTTVVTLPRSNQTSQDCNEVHLSETWSFLGFGAVAAVKILLSIITIKVSMASYSHMQKVCGCFCELWEKNSTRIFKYATHCLSFRKSE